MSEIKIKVFSKEHYNNTWLGVPSIVILTQDNIDIHISHHGVQINGNLELNPTEVLGDVLIKMGQLMKERAK